MYTAFSFIKVSVFCNNSSVLYFFSNLDIVVNTFLKLSFSSGVVRYGFISVNVGKALRSEKKLRTIVHTLTSIIATESLSICLALGAQMITLILAIN